MAEQGEGAPKRGGWVLGLSINLLLLIGAAVGGLIARPYLERQFLSGEEPRAEGMQLKQRVDSAILLVEEKQRTETMRLSTVRSPGSSGDVISAGTMSEYERLKGLLRDLVEIKTSLARAEVGGWQYTVVRTLRPLVVEKLAAIETSKAQ